MNINLRGFATSTTNQCLKYIGNLIHYYDRDNTNDYYVEDCTTYKKMSVGGSISSAYCDIYNGIFYYGIEKQENNYVVTKLDVNNQTTEVFSDYTSTSRIYVDITYIILPDGSKKDVLLIDKKYIYDFDGTRLYNLGSNTNLGKYCGIKILGFDYEEDSVTASSVSSTNVSIDTTTGSITRKVNHYMFYNYSDIDTFPVNKDLCLVVGTSSDYTKATTIRKYQAIDLTEVPLSPTEYTTAVNTTEQILGEEETVNE